MEKKDQNNALENLLYNQLEMVQRVITDTMNSRKKIGDEKYYTLIEKWSQRETEIRHEISELN